VAQKSNNNIIGSELIELLTVPSTNNYAAELISRTKVQNGTVIMAHEQTAGRGQRGREWLSESGKDLAFSVVIIPDSLTVNMQFYLSRAIVLGIRDFLVDLVRKPVYVKWPNDVYVGDKKICGILIENEIIGNNVAHSIIGVGLNVSFSNSNVDFIHTSLEREMGLLPDRKHLLKEIFLTMNKRYLELLAKRYSRLSHDHAEHLYMKGHWTEFDLRGKVVRAKILDCENDGRLMVELEDGKIISEGTGAIRQILYGTDIPK